MDESSLGIHKIELVIESSPGLSNSSCVRKHADSALNLSKIAARNNSWWLVVDSNFEASWAPVDELDGSFGLDLSDGRVDILGDDISSVKQAASHVLAMSWIALDHLVHWVEAGVGDLGYTQLLVVGLLSRDDRGVSGEREVNSRVGDEIGLELGQIYIERAVESKGSGDGADDLTDESIQVGVSRSLNAQVSSANIVNRLVVDHESAVGVFKSRMSCQNRVVGLNNSS